MSAWMTSNEHISALITGAIAKGVVLEEEAQKAGMKLWRANTFSLKCRYGDDPKSYYRFKYNKVEVNDCTLVKLCHCFHYQACEYDAYGKSDAFGIVNGILNKVSVDHESQEYLKAPWGI